MRALDLTGQKFGRWTVLRRDSVPTRWVCICECGTVKSVYHGSLRNGNSKSCGCLKRENPSRTTHGHSKTRLYRIWCGIKSRCNNPNRKAYKLYGARGIRIHESWNDFEEFYRWSMENGYADNLIIDRIDTTGNYEPSNCRWTTFKVNNRNRINNAKITYNGQTKTVAEWAEILGLDPKTIYGRRSRGLPPEEIFNLDGMVGDSYAPVQSGTKAKTQAV